MEPITDDALLLARMCSLFPSDLCPGVETTITEVEYERGIVALRYELSTDTANQLGFAQGGTVATLLDGCLGIAGAVKSGGRLAMPLAELNVSFIRPVPVGVVHGRGSVVRLGRSIGFLEGALTAEDGSILAKASGTAVPTPFPD